MQASSEFASLALDHDGEPRPERIALITDFGSGPYIGQLELLAAALAPRLPVIQLLNDAPSFRPDLAAYLIPALVRGMPARTLYLCVVDPGVGGARAALALRRGEDWFVGPDNGLLAPLMRPAEDLPVAQAPTRKATSASVGSLPDQVREKPSFSPSELRKHCSSVPERRLWRIDWRPAFCSDSFHGRDLFLPIALALTRGRLPLPCQGIPPEMAQGYAGLRESGRILYVDHYGNLMTGLDADRASQHALLQAGDRVLSHARTFCEVEQGQAFWYRNAFGLVEIAANQARADHLLGLLVGDRVAWTPD